MTKRHAKRRNSEMSERPRTDNLVVLESTLGHSFANRQLLLDALTHRSYAYERAGPGVVPNERLEWLGDAVLALISSDLLFAQYPGADEGVLTQYRAALVRASTLAEFAAQLELGTYLRLGRGEEATGGRTREGLLASAFEAILGALYLEGGLTAVRPVLEPLLAAQIAQIEQAGGRRKIKDDKSLLQELAQAELGITPRYRMISVSDPAQERPFVVEVVIGDHVAGRGEGSSKQQAEQDAAHQALADPGWRELAEERGSASSEREHQTSPEAHEPV